MSTVHRCARRASMAMLILAAVGATACARDEWQQPDRVVADMNLRDGSVVADVGCGRGYFVARLAKAVGKTGTVWAEDVSEGALKGVKQAAEKQGLANVKVVQGEATDTHLPDGALDAALFVNVYHHVPQEHRAGLAARRQGPVGQGLPHPEGQPHRDDGEGGPRAGRRVPLPAAPGLPAVPQAGRG